MKEINKRNPRLIKSLSDKTNISTINELLLGKKHEEVANIYNLSRSRITQIWNEDEKEEAAEKEQGKEEIRTLAQCLRWVILSICLET